MRTQGWFVRKEKIVLDQETGGATVATERHRAASIRENWRANLAIGC